MGCSGTNQTNEYDLEQKMGRQKDNLSYKITENEIKIQQYESQIQNLDYLIKQGETDIQMNQFQLKESELKSKAKKLLEYKREKDRTQQTLEKLQAMNEALKNNKENLERKIDEQGNVRELRKGNDIMNQINKENHTKTIQENIDKLYLQKKQEEETKRILERGNRQMVGDENLINADDYLKQLLGGTGH